MESSTEKRLEQRAGLNFRSDVIALDLLCSPATTSDLDARVEALDPGDHRNFLRGFRLAVATPLVGMLRFSVVRPELLGFEFDERVFNWLNYRNPQSVEPLISAVSDPFSGVGTLCHIFNDLQLGLRRSESGLPDTLAVIEKCRTFAHEFGECFLSTELVRFDGSASQLEDGELLRLCVAERVLDYVKYEPSAVTTAHQLIWGHGEDWPMIDDRFVLEAETHHTAIPRNFLGTGIPDGFRDGLLFGFNSIIKRIGISLPSDDDAESLAAPDWFDELLAVVNPKGVDGVWPSHMCGLAEFSSLDTSGLAQRLGVNMGGVSSKGRLAAILGSDRVRLMSDAGATDAMELEIMLGGATAASRGSRIQLLVLTHTVDSDEREWVSIAFRLPFYGPLGSNASTWFLFYKLFHEGPVFDNDVAFAIRNVEKLLSRFEDRLEVEEIDDLDSEDFLPMCTLPAFRAMRELSHAAVETNADLRSGNAELLAGFWLACQGYCNVKISFKSALMGKFEYDVIGVKDGRCLVVEIKSASLRDSELQRQINRFAGKVAHLNERVTHLERAIGYASDIDKVSGLFIFLGDLDHFVPNRNGIELWCYDDFVSALNEAGISGRIVGLLDRSNIIHQLKPGVFPHDPFFAGLEGTSTER